MIRKVLLMLLSIGMCPLAEGSGVLREAQETLNKSLRQEAMAGVIPRIEGLLLRGADINSKAPHGETALEYAIRFGRYGAALKLISLGADPDTEDDSGLSPLLRAAGECNASRVVDALLRAGARVNHHDAYGRTALINAAHADCARTVSVILLRAKHEVDLDARDDALQTAMDLARVSPVLQMLEMAQKYQRARTENWSGLTKKSLQ